MSRRSYRQDTAVILALTFRESLDTHLRLCPYRCPSSTRLRLLRGTVDKMHSMDNLLHLLRHSCHNHLRNRSSLPNRRKSRLIHGSVASRSVAIPYSIHRRLHRLASSRRYGSVRFRVFPILSVVFIVAGVVHPAWVFRHIRNCPT